MSEKLKEDDSSLVSPDLSQSEVKDDNSKPVHKFRPMEQVVSEAIVPDSNDPTSTTMAGPKPDLGGSFKMPIFKGPIRKTSKVKNFKTPSEKSPADSTKSPTVSVPVPPEKRNENERDSDEKLKKTKRSPAEILATPPPPYREPAWSGIPEDEYYLEVLKGGTICAKIGLNDHPFHLFGRLETNHVQLDHPSLSRYHAVLQYRSVGDNNHDPGFYLYDLGSTHGTTLNKNKIEPKVYCRVQAGHMFKLAGSTRLYILQGGKSDAEFQNMRNDLSVEQLKDMQLRQMEAKEILRMKEEEGKIEKVSEDSDTGISWGMAEDADAESDLSHNPFALDADDDKEAPYLKDPKKALRGFFEREGNELEYKVEEMGIGRSHQYICKVLLPLDDPSGNPIVAEAAVSGKKKEAVLACALEACKILDRHGVLRQAKHESKKRKNKNWAEDDYYDSDDDTFLDRTGEIEKKRLKRMQKAGAEKQELLTYDKLLLQLQDVEKEMKKAEENLAIMAQGKMEHMPEDSLDAFMDSIKCGFKDRNQRAKLKLRLVDLRKEEMKLKKLINIAKPAKMPEIKSSFAGDGISSETKPKMQAMIGKMHGAKKFRFAPLVTKVPTVTVSSPMEQEEEEEDEEEYGGEKNVNKMEVEEAECQPDSNQSRSQSRSKSDDDPANIHTSESFNYSTQSENHEVLSSLPSHLTKGSSSGTELSKLSTKGPSLPPIKGPVFRPRVSAASLPKGPFLPSGYNDEVEEEDEDEEEERKPMLYTKKTKVTEEATDEDISDWVPPKGQTGDGRTSLNDKFGY
ncbi:kanadaptin-like [Anneissia japonica]|uniref:kanadaptin-like n=1 Tax=Anneissia japonica TaxID=1529436 RepID=UPI00142574C9|nr:kanadaptin-like [Anneissia japonica]